MDITNKDMIEHWVAESFGGDNLPDILINNAGSGHFGKVDEMPSEQWRRMIETNLNGLFELTSQIVPMIKQASGGPLPCSGAGLHRNREETGACAPKQCVGVDGLKR